MDILRSVSFATSLIPKPEKFEDTPPAEEESFIKRNIGTIVRLVFAALAFTVSWICNTYNGVGTGMKIFYGLFASTFGIFYLFYYLLFKRCSILAGTGGPDEFRVNFGPRYGYPPSPYGYPPPAYGYPPAQPGINIKL